MADAHPAVFFVSTGRCGTQWLQKALGGTYSDLAVVTHEPVRGPYEPKRYLRAYDRLDELLAAGAVARHLAFIQGTIGTKTYIETGWPSYPALPLFIDRLAGRVRIVHLVRHPVPVALSLSSHEVYAPRQGWVAGAAISPFDPGTVQNDLQPRWAAMEPYEKCLFWWTEIHLYALELRERHPAIPFAFVRYEDLFDPATGALRDLIGFLELPWRDAIETFRTERVDRYRRPVPAAERQLVLHYPRTVALAAKFGYDLLPGTAF